MEPRLDLTFVDGCFYEVLYEPVMPPTTRHRRPGRIAIGAVWLSARVARSGSSAVAVSPVCQTA
jgi:hypothetical protein